MLRVPYLICLACASCANPAHVVPSVDPSEIRACMQTQAASLDDRISNARTVGLSVARSCSAEINDAIRAATDGATGDYRASFADRFWAQATEEATRVVLRQRAR